MLSLRKGVQGLTYIRSPSIAFEISHVSLSTSQANQWEQKLSRIVKATQLHRPSQPLDCSINYTSIRTLSTMRSSRKKPLRKHSDAKVEYRTNDRHMDKRHDVLLIDCLRKGSSSSSKNEKEEPKFGVDHSEFKNVLVDGEQINLTVVYGPIDGPIDQHPGIYKVQIRQRYEGDDPNNIPWIENPEAAVEGKNLVFEFVPEPAMTVPARCFYEVELRKNNFSKATTHSPTFVVLEEYSRKFAPPHLLLSSLGTDIR